MVFQAPFNKISKKSKTTYAQWCEKHGIKWAAVHAIPIDWLTWTQNQSLWHMNHVLTVARQMLTHVTLTDTRSVSHATLMYRRMGTIHLYKWKQMKEYNSSGQLNSCTNEESLRKPWSFSEYTDMATRLGSLIMTRAGELSVSKSNQRKKSSTTKELLLKVFSDNTYFQQVANELSSQKEN